MAIELQADASDYAHLARGIAGLPDQIKAKAASRALSRITHMARTQIIKRSAERVDITQARVRALTTLRLNAGGNSADVIMRSNWIGLYKLGARQTKSGVRVRLRGSYRHAFIATMKSGHTGVFMRSGKPISQSTPIGELFGPNPAHDITNNPDVFLEVLAKLIGERLMPRYLHEVENLLPR